MTASETSGKLVNVSPALVTPLSDAVITLVPTPCVVASPEALIVATAGAADAHVTEFVMFRVEPSL